MILAQKLQRAEVWDKPQCAGGSRLAILATLSRLQGTAQVSGDNVLEGTIALQGAAIPGVVAHRILRVDDGTEFDEWVISTIKKNSVTGQLTFTGLPVSNLLGGKALVGQTDGAGVTRYDFELVGLLPSQIIDAYVLPALVAAGITWVARGTIAQDVRLDMTFSWDSPLSVIRTLASRLGLEFILTRVGVTGYNIDLVTSIGASANPVDVRYSKNLLNHERQQSVDQQVTRVFPRGMDQGGYRATMARATWQVATKGATGQNSALWSRDLTNAAWNVGGATAARTAVGIDGTPNTATVVTDADAANFVSRGQSWVVSDNNNAHNVEIWVRKDTDQSRAPLFRLLLTNGITPVGSDVTLDTRLGTFAWRLYQNAPPTHTEAVSESRDKLWWIVRIRINNNTTGNTSLQLQIHPSVMLGVVLAGAYAQAGVGSITVGQVTTSLNTTGLNPPFETGATGVTGTKLTLVDPAGGDGPIQFDDQLLFAYTRSVDGTLGQIVDTVLSDQSVWTSTTNTKFTVGDLIQFRLNAAGADLTFLTSPTDEALDAGIQVAALDLPDVPGTNNLIPNPALRNWTAGLPVSWTKLGTPTVTQDVATHVRVGGSSARVQATLDGQGFQSTPVAVTPSALQPYIGALASFWIVSGKVRLELVLTYASGTLIIPFAPQFASSSELGRWVDLTIESYNAFTPTLITAAALRVVAHQGAAEFYFDAAQLIEGPGILPFMEGSGGTRLWQLANERLRLYSGVFLTEAVDAADLFRLDGAKWPDTQVVLGAPIRVMDPGMDTLSYQTRIVGFTRDYINDGAMSLVLSTRPEDLTGELSKPARPSRVTLDDTATTPTQYNPPTAIVRHVSAGSIRTAQVLELDGALGSPLMLPLQWRYQVNAGAFTAWSSVALPVQVSITRTQYYTGNVTLETMQADGQVGRFSWSLGSQNDALDDTTGRTRRGQPSDDGNYDVPATSSNGFTTHGSVTDFGGRILRRFLGKVNIGDTDDVDGVPEGVTFQRTRATALTTGQIDMSKVGVINRITTYINWLNATALGWSAWSASGLTFAGGKTALSTIDSDVTSNKFHTDTSGPGSALQVDYPIAVIFDTFRMYQAGANTNAQWAVEYWNGSAWVSLASSWNPNQAGWNQVTFGRTAATSFRIRLSNTPGSGPYTNQVEWIDSLGANMGNHTLYQHATEIFDRVHNVIERLNPQFRAITKISTGLAVNRSLLKLNPGDANDADGLQNSVTKRVIPFTVLRASDNALLTRVGNGAAIGDYAAGSLALARGKLIDLTFDDFTAESELIQQSTSVTIQAVIDSTASVGTKVLEIGPGYAQIQGRTFFPVNATKLYRIRTRVKRTADQAGSQLYIGFLSYLYNGGVANSNSGAVYFGTQAAALVVADGWVERTTYVRGADVAFATGSMPASTDPSNPARWHVGTTQAILYILANYPNPTGGGTTRIDYIAVDELDEEVSSRSGTVGFGGQNGLRYPVNRHVEQVFGALDAQTKTFGATYENNPEVNVIPLTWTLPGASSTVDRKVEIKATNITLTTCQTRAVISTGGTTSSKSEGPSLTFGTNGTVGVSITISGGTGGTMYWNLSQANSTLTTYVVNYVITTGTTGLYRVYVYKNTGTTDNVNWSLVGSRTYDINISGLVDNISFDAAMGLNWDIKLVWQSPGGSGSIGSQCECKDVVYNLTTAGTETALTPAGSSLLVQSREKA